MKESKKTNQRSGFTVLEMLVATAILAGMSFMLFTALDHITDTIQKAHSRTANYQDTRMILDQMSRELQQAIPGNYGGGNSNPPIYNHIFYAREAGGARSTAGFGLPNPSGLHFIAVIDNQEGHEEVEVHYHYDNENTLWKCMIPYPQTMPAPAADWTAADHNPWDFVVPMGGRAPWHNTPEAAPNMDTRYYTPILTGVYKMTFQTWVTEALPTKDNMVEADWPDYFQPCDHEDFPTYNTIPNFIRVNLEVFEPHVIKRFGTAQKAYTELEKIGTGKAKEYLKTYSIMVQLPRSRETGNNSL
jgi:prepilin-type N-terminal cleavage/methylation domain-containing protein